MAFIYVTEAGQTVTVKNGDIVVVDIPGGGDVTIVAANPGVREFRIDYGDDDGAADTVIVDTSTFASDNLQILVNGYDSTDRLTLDGAGDVQAGSPRPNEATFAYGDGNSGRVRILDPGERDLGDHPPPIIICFAEGTAIDTEIGPRPVESLRPGDAVATFDNGMQPLRWIGSRRLGADDLRARPDFRPVRIAAGALGGGLPWADLTVSPQHRIRLADWRTELLYGHPEVLVPARALVDGAGIRVADRDSVTYYHLLFDRHELVTSNGAVSESLHPGDMAACALGPEAFRAVARILGPGMERRPLARPALRVGEARAALAYAA